MLSLRHAIRDALWLVPLICLLALTALAVLTLAVDRSAGYDLVPQSVTGSPTAVQQLLSTAGTALLTLATVVVSLTLVAVQVAMGQFSPRMVRAILEDRRNQLALGLFVGTFSYTLAVLRDVDDQSGQIPGLSVVIAYGLILAAVAALILFIDKAARSLRVSGMIDLVGDATRAEVAALPRAAEPEAPDPHTIVAEEGGNVTVIDAKGLVKIAARANSQLELVPVMGDFVATGGPLFRVHGNPVNASAARRKVLFEPERSHDEDPAYGLRKLVDMALRAIASSPFDDPTTSVQALHRIHDCLRLLATRELPSGRYRDDDGVVRLVVPMLEWNGYVRLAFEEIRLAGAGSPQVARGLRAVLEDLRSVAPAERRPPLERELELLDAAVQGQYEQGWDEEVASGSDGLGMGSGADMVARPRAQ